MAFLFMFFAFVFVFIKFVCTTSITSVYRCVFQFVCFLIHATLHFSKQNLHSHFQLTVFSLSRFSLCLVAATFAYWSLLTAPSNGVLRHFMTALLSLLTSVTWFPFLWARNRSHLWEQLLLSGKSLGEQLFSSSLLGKVKALKLPKIDTMIEERLSSFTWRELKVRKWKYANIFCEKIPSSNRFSLSIIVYKI